MQLLKFSLYKYIKGKKYNFFGLYSGKTEKGLKRLIPPHLVNEIIWQNTLSHWRRTLTFLSLLVKGKQ